MDQTNQHNLSSLSKPHLTRKTTNIILLTLFLLNLLYFLSTYIPFILPSFSLEVLLSYLSDRIYIFLLCNGILVFLITRSGLIIGKPPLAILTKENSIKAFRRLELELSDREDAITQEAKEAEEKKGEEERKQNEILVVTNKENEYLLLVKKLDDAEEQDQEEEKFDATQENQQGQEEEEEKDFDDTEENQERRQEDEEDFDDTEDHQDDQEEGDFDCTQEYRVHQEEDFDDTEEDQEEEEEEEEEEEDGGIELLSLQELNIKCDNFIKFMREGIQIHVKKLVMV